MSHLGAQVGHLVHANKDLGDELAHTKIKVDQQCDVTAKEALGLAYKIF